MQCNPLQEIQTIKELTKAWECVPRSGIPNNFPAATLLPIQHRNKENHNKHQLGSTSKALKKNNENEI
jgi:hypothetical protein